MFETYTVVCIEMNTFKNNRRLVEDRQLITVCRILHHFGGVAQWVERWYLTCELSLAGAMTCS